MEHRQEEMIRANSVFLCCSQYAEIISEKQSINIRVVPLEIPTGRKTDCRFIVRSQKDGTDVHSSLKWYCKLADLLNTCQSFFLAKTYNRKMGK